MNEESTNESINKKIHGIITLFSNDMTSTDNNNNKQTNKQTNKQQRQKSYFNFFRNVGDNTDTNNFENEKYLRTPITK